MRSVDCVRLIRGFSFFISKEGEEELVVVELNVVVFGGLVVDLLFNFVVIVVEDENVRMDVLVEYGINFLKCL